MREGGGMRVRKVRRGGEGWCDGTLTILSEFSGADLRAYREGVSGTEHVRGHIMGCVRFMDTGECCVLVGTAGCLLELHTGSGQGSKCYYCTWKYGYVTAYNTHILAS